MVDITSIRNRSIDVVTLLATYRASARTIKPSMMLSDPTIDPTMVITDVQLIPVVCTVATARLIYVNPGIAPVTAAGGPCVGLSGNVDLDSTQSKAQPSSGV